MEYLFLEETSISLLILTEVSQVVLSNSPNERFWIKL